MVLSRAGRPLYHLLLPRSRLPHGPPPLRRSDLSLPLITREAQAIFSLRAAEPLTDPYALRASSSSFPRRATSRMSSGAPAPTASLICRRLAPQPPRDRPPPPPPAPPARARAPPSSLLAYLPSIDRALGAPAACGSLADVLKRRAPRVLLSGFVLAVAVSGLTACRTSPNVAAYVGDEQVTVTELENAVDERLEDPELAAFAAEQRGRVHPAGALAAGAGGGPRRRRGALRRPRSTTTTSGAASRTCSPTTTPTRCTASSPQQGIGRADVFETVRQQLVRQAIAEAEGEAEAPTEAELQARYEEVRESLARGLRSATSPCPTRRPPPRVLAQLTADPASYPAVAAQYPGPTTLPALRDRGPADQLPGRAGRGHRGGGSRTPASPPRPEAGGVVVTFVEGPVYPPFEEVRPQLEQEAAEAAEAAGGELVDAVREDLGVTVNPRLRRPRGGPARRRRRRRRGHPRATSAARTRPPSAAARPGTDPVPVALVVTVSPRLPGLLEPGRLAGAVRRAAARRPARCRRRPRTALRADGWDVADVPDAAAATR